MQFYIERIYVSSLPASCTFLLMRELGSALLKAANCRQSSSMRSARLHVWGLRISTSVALIVVSILRSNLQYRAKLAIFLTTAKPSNIYLHFSGSRTVQQGARCRVAPWCDRRDESMLKIMVFGGAVAAKTASRQKN